MTSALANKKSKIIVVDASAPVRQMMTDTLRTALGFESVEGKTSIQDVVQHLEVDTVDWVIVPLMADQPVNAMHLLKICTEHPELKNVRFSLFLETEEQYVLPTAFEHGLLSWHKKPFTKDTFGDELKALLTRLEADHFKEPMTSASYLRQFLKSVKQHQAQHELEKNLLDLYPGNPQLLINLAEPQFHLGKKDAAKATLAQARMLDEKLDGRVNEIARILFGEALPAGVEGASGFNVLGLKTCVIVDSDESVRRDAGEILHKLGITDVKAFGDGDEAWAYLEKEAEPDLIIMEWRIPRLSGPLLLQRLRQKGFLTVPVLVLSSLLKPEDMPLVREIGVANLIRKPLNKDLFIPAMIWTVQQERLPTEHQVLERKIRALLKAHKKDEAEPLRAQYLADPAVPLKGKRLVEAEYAFETGNYPLARDAGVEALKLAGDGILVLNLLGKTFMRLKDHTSALKCFMKAQDLSPNNIERLCHMAESQTELGDHVAAEDLLGDAKTLDPDSKTVQEAEARVALTKGDTASAKKLMANFESLDSLVAYMNNKAVAYSKCGHTKDAIELYKRTMQSIPDDKPEIKAIVTYNLALALVRDGELEEATVKLELVVAVKGVKVAKKAQALRDRLKQALEKGTEFKLKAADSGAAPATSVTPIAGAPAAPEPDPTKLSTEDDHKRLVSAVEAKRGDLCCHLLFHVEGGPDVRTTALLAKAPRFQLRGAIERAEGLGAERAAKAAS